MKEEKTSAGISTAGMVLGICALVFVWLPLINWALAILATIFGAIGVKNKYKFGWAGLIMGIISLIICLIVPILIFTMTGIALSSV